MQSAAFARLNQTQAAMLQQAFEAFSRSSSQLEERYQLLLQETEHLRLQLREKDEKIKRSERLAMLGETAAAIAHEVRNPLGSIKLFISLLRQDLQGQPQDIEMIDNIERSIATLDHAVSNILQFSRGQSVQTAPLNLNAVLAQEIQQLAVLPGCQTRIVTSLHGSPFILGNEHDLKRAFHNLILNSLQALRYQGEIRIETCDTQRSELQIRISDDGPGIPENMLERIFEPFVTTKNEGTGLGLAIVRRIVEAHGGRISARAGQGAQFTILLPRHGEKPGFHSGLKET